MQQLRLRTPLRPFFAAWRKGDDNHLLADHLAKVFSHRHRRTFFESVQRGGDENPLISWASHEFRIGDHRLAAQSAIMGEAETQGQLRALGSRRDAGALVQELEKLPQIVGRPGNPSCLRMSGRTHGESPSAAKHTNPRTHSRLRQSAYFCHFGQLADQQSMVRIGAVTSLR